MSRLWTVAPTRCVFFLCKFPEEEDVDENRHAEEPDNPQDQRCYHARTAISCKNLHFQHFNLILVLFLNMRLVNHITYIFFQIKSFTSERHWHKLCDVLLNLLNEPDHLHVISYECWLVAHILLVQESEINYLLVMTWFLEGIVIDFDCSKHRILPEHNLTWRNVATQARTAIPSVNNVTSLGRNVTSLSMNLPSRGTDVISPGRNQISRLIKVTSSGRNVSSPLRTYLTWQECDLTWDRFPIYGEEDEDSDTEGRQQKHQSKSCREENGHVIPVYNGWNKRTLARTNN